MVNRETTTRVPACFQISDASREKNRRQKEVQSIGSFVFRGPSATAKQKQAFLSIKSCSISDIQSSMVVEGEPHATSSYINIDK